MFSVQYFWLFRRKKVLKLAFALLCFVIPAMVVFVILISRIDYYENSEPAMIFKTVVVEDSPTRKDINLTVNEKRDFIKQMMKDAWDSYVRYAWGENELKPISETGHSSKVFNGSKLGTTIVDSLDTLYIMGLNDEYHQGRNWITENFGFDNFKDEVSVFETNVRFIGGLLSCYALTGDTMYKDKAYKLAKQLLPAFNTPSGIPHSMTALDIPGVIYNRSNEELASGATSRSRSSVLSEFGSLHLEFVYLSDITGDPIFREKVDKIRKVLQILGRPKGLYSNFVDPGTSSFTDDNHISMGAFGDSFYEYLLKSFIQTGDMAARIMYDEALQAFEKNGLILRSKGGLQYFAEMRDGIVEHKMDHLACFAGGMLALGAYTDPGLMEKAVNISKSNHMKIAEEITNTCHESYNRTPTGLGPEKFRFSDGLEAEALLTNEKYYKLRPEVVESYFILWRVTGNAKYREWGWDAARAIQKYCKAGPRGGYAGLRDVYNNHPKKYDLQESFFLAETLKYLYLLFSSKQLLDLDLWVFNTEAHPLPIKDKNPYYRPYKLNSSNGIHALKI